jgi:predicted HTH domain antitoxin
MKQQQEYDISIKGMVDAGIYESEEKAINEAIKSLLKENPEIKKKVAIYMYDNEEISLGRAAEIAGVCFEEMKMILVENGIELRLCPRDYEEARKEHLEAKEILKNERNRKQHRHI